LGVCLVKDYFSPETSELIKKMQELEKENKELKKTLDESEKNFKEKLLAMAIEIEELKVKAKERSKTPDSTRSSHSQDKEDKADNTSNDSKSSKEDKKEQESAEEKEKQLFKRKLIRDMAKSPSVILKDADAQYYDRAKNPQKQSQDRIESKVWKMDILPFLEEKDQRAKIIAKIKTVISDYIPGKYRSKIWAILIGNPLQMKRKIYDQLCASMEARPLDDKVKNQIKEDLTRTYPHLKSFNRGEALNDELQYLLELFHFARPDIGYVQGLAYPASMLLMYMDRYHAFKCLVNLIACRPFLKNLYKFKLEEVRLVCRVFDRFLKNKLPQVQKHLERNNITSEVYLIEWLVTLFCRNFHIHDVAKIWDLFLLEGESAFLKVALKIFQIIEPEIIQKDYAETLYSLRTCTHDMNINHLIYSLPSSSLTQEKFEKALNKEKEKLKQKTQERSKSMFG